MNLREYYGIKKIVASIEVLNYPPAEKAGFVHLA